MAEDAEAAEEAREALLPHLAAAEGDCTGDESSMATRAPGYGALSPPKFSVRTFYLGSASRRGVKHRIEV